MPRIKAVILDLDGTLIHTTVDFRRMKADLIQMLLDHGIPSNVVSIDMTVINNLKVAREYLEQKGRRGEIAGIDGAANEMMSRTELEQVDNTTAIGGVREALTSIRGRGYLIGLLTRGSRIYTEAALRAAGIDERFDAVICRDDFSEVEAKPNGKALLRMAELLGVDPRECLIVGDHAIDMECAKSSGAYFVGVLTGSFDTKRWQDSDVPEVIESVTSLPGFLERMQERS